MEVFDISKIDLYSIKDLRRGELANIHSLLLFFYSKYNGNSEISFKYSEISWLYYHSVLKIVNRLSELNLIYIINRPKPHEPFIIRLKPNNELHYILNKDKRIKFHDYNYVSFSKKDFIEAIDCSSITEHFIQSSVRSWIRNVNNGVWDIYKFLTIAKIVSYFKCDHKVKTFTINKYCSKNANFIKSVKFLYEKIPDSQKEFIYTQFLNTTTEMNIKTDKSFVNIVNNYVKHISLPEKEEFIVLH